MYQDSSQIYDDLIQKIMDENKQVTSMFIHELRNPLALIKGTLQYIEMKYQEVKEYKYWNQLPELIHDMEILMSDACLLNSGTSLNIQKTNLLELIRAVVDSYMPQAENQQKRLIFIPSPNCESIICSYPCDSDKIKQVLSNLLKNALEATSTGDSIQTMVSLDSTDEDPMIFIHISDNGLVIPEDELNTIFMPFITNKSGGTGVGLALAKRIIEAHRGSIHVTSTSELTEFTILLPLPIDL